MNIVQQLTNAMLTNELRRHLGTFYAPQLLVKQLEPGKLVAVLLRETYLLHLKIREVEVDRVNFLFNKPGQIGVAICLFSETGNRCIRETDERFDRLCLEIIKALTRSPKEKILDQILGD